MRGSVALLLPVAVSASPIIDKKVLNDLFCKVNDVVLHVLEKDAAATKYCSSFLSIPTLTFSTTATVTPASVTTTTPLTITEDTVTSTQTETATVTDTQTITSTSTRTDYATITSTTSTSTITCLNSAYTYTAPTGVIPGDAAAPAPEGKRGAANYAKPSAIPKDWSQQYISTACSCLSIPTPSTTSTATVTLIPGTITEASTLFETPTATATTTVTSTTTESATVSEEATTTSTLTAYAVATTIASNGVQYRKYTHSFDANRVDGGGFTSTYFKGLSAEFSGSISSLSFATPNWPSGSTTLTLSDGRAFASDYAALLLQGFFIAKETGTHVFTSRGNEVDNYGYAWTGDAAYSAWNDANAAIRSSRTGGGNVDGNAYVSLNAGDAIPLTFLWANGGGVGQNVVRVTMPSGRVVTNHAGYFVQACSSSVFA
ncbi:hypothetical protein DPSP01_001859 [Paraphaeosphaeria sporulosa]|uniref:PA14 domain-containing protein n=1 Tax=Paraphaeosphaeria sporulosa TaxID=1460663 RepID=A0A177C512_9PLEO|nr:uncharacterized protein CC84DRAFT_1221279 [Paraphaeosphaeria sporulosa]OAG01807.1 hypothetical protein CC84DRAFT_1221279 [Paraphaeosphaeria sporulosa]